MGKQFTVNIIFVITLMSAGALVVGIGAQQSAEASHLPAIIERKAPIAISDENMYIVWSSNSTGHDDVMLRASSDGGATFSDKINLSNSTNADSFDTEIAAGGDKVIVTWWERNSTSTEPVVRISSDNGATFGPLLRLATNGTIGQVASE